jgi:4-amino-4-deoxy-L-arabinose transferase-like glycosyltransferase
LNLPVAVPWRTATRPTATLNAPAAIRRLGAAATLDLLLVLALFAGAFVLALTHPWSHAYIGEAQYGDAAYWDFNGENWARGYASSKAPDIRPGYSVFLAIVYALSGADFRNAFVAQALLFAAMVVMLYAIGKRLSGRLTGVLAATLLALDPYMWEWTATSTTETLGSFANVAALLCLVELCKRPRSMKAAALFGVFIAIANIVRVFTLFFVGPALVLILLLLHAPRWTRVRQTTVVFGAIAGTLLPAVVYQYVSTGDPGLSSNSASAVFAASSPKYKVWTPEIYDDVVGQMQARGEEVTSRAVDAEFRRLTIQNYVSYPGFQLGRIAEGFVPYATFEGQVERPDRYTFFRPYVLIAFVLVVVGLTVKRVAKRPWVLLPPLALLGGLVFAPLPVLVAAQGGAVAGAGIFTARQRRPRDVALLAIAMFWAFTGLLAVTTAGISGFLLNRLYTQVEPARCLLIASAATAVVFVLLPRSTANARVRALGLFGRAIPRPSAVTPVVLRFAGVAVALVLGIGGIRLVAANAAQPPDPGVLEVPTEGDLAGLAQRLQLPGDLRYINADSFEATRARLVTGKLPPDLTAYAIPGQFTRFLWYLPEQDRTLYWFVFADRLRPAALDRNLLTAESSGHLPVNEYGNHPGLLVLLPTSAYFDATGDVAQQNVLAARAFIPLDDTLRRFRLQDATTFPLSVPLYDRQRFDAATKHGQVAEMGPIRVQLGDRNTRALSLQPTEMASNGEHIASITYGDVWVPPAAQFTAWVALHPRVFGHTDVGQLRVEVDVVSDGREMPLAALELDPMNAQQRVYLPFHVALSNVQGQRVQLVLRVASTPSATATGEVLVGEPRIFAP